MRARMPLLMLGAASLWSCEAPERTCEVAAQPELFEGQTVTLLGGIRTLADGSFNISLDCRPRQFLPLRWVRDVDWPRGNRPSYGPGYADPVPMRRVVGTIVRDGEQPQGWRVDAYSFEETIID